MYSTYFRSLLFWPKAFLMTNNAVNPIVYINSNTNLRIYILQRFIPKNNAEKTVVYQEWFGSHISKNQSTYLNDKVHVTNIVIT